MDKSDLLGKIMERSLIGAERNSSVDYQANYFTLEESDHLYTYLEQLPYDYVWVPAYGRQYIPSRMEATFSDPELRPTLSQAHPWSSELLTLKLKLERYLRTSFNCLIATYHKDGFLDGSFEKHDFLEDCELPTAILNFGAPCDIQFTQKYNDCLTLSHGSLLVIKENKGLYKIPVCQRLKEPRITLTFKKVKITGAIPTPFKSMKRGSKEEPECSKKLEEECSKNEEQECSQKMGRDVCGNAPAIPMEEEDTPIIQLLKDPTIFINAAKTLKRFGLSYETYISVELYQNELRVHLKEFCTKSYSSSGVFMDLWTFYELGRKLDNISYSLNYTSDSCIINNSILCIVKNHTLVLKQFKGFQIMKNEVRLNSQQVRKLQECLSDVEQYIIDYVFVEQIGSSVCSDIPYEPQSMSLAFTDLKHIIQEDLRDIFHKLYPCEIHSNESDCLDSCENLSFKNLINFSSAAKMLQERPCEIHANPRQCTDSCQCLSYKNLMNFSSAMKMLCRVSAIKEQFLINNNYYLAKDTYNFKQLAKDLF